MPPMTRREFLWIIAFLLVLGPELPRPRRTLVTWRTDDGRVGTRTFLA